MQLLNVLFFIKFFSILRCLKYFILYILKNNKNVASAQNYITILIRTIIILRKFHKNIYMSIVLYNANSSLYIAKRSSNPLNCFRSSSYKKTHYGVIIGGTDRGNKYIKYSKNAFNDFSTPWDSDPKRE